MRGDQRRTPRQKRSEGLGAQMTLESQYPTQHEITAAGYQMLLLSVRCETSLECLFLFPLFRETAPQPNAGWEVQSDFCVGHFAPKVQALAFVQDLLLPSRD